MTGLRERVRRAVAKARPPLEAAVALLRPAARKAPEIVVAAGLVVSVLLGMPGPRVDLDGDEQQALSALAGSGLVPPLRLVPRVRPVRSMPAPRGADWEGLDDPAIFSGFVTGSEG